MATATSFDQFVTTYTQRVDKLVRCAQLIGVENSSSSLQLLSSISDEVSQLEELAAAQREALERDRGVLSEMKTLLASAHETRSELEHASHNIPAHLPNVRERAGATSGGASNASSVSSATSRDDDSVASSSGIAESARQHHPPPSSSASAPAAASAHQPSSAQSRAAASRKVSASLATHARALPTLGYVTLPEFNDVPKYIRGRLAYDVVNIAVEELKKAFESKYKLIAVPRSQLTDAEVKKRKAYKAQETKDVEGRHFVTDHDIRTTTELKLDATGRGVMTLLRHCNRLREVHGGGFVRFVIQT